MKKRVFLFSLIAMNGGLHAMFLVRALVLKPPIILATAYRSRPYCTNKLPSWYYDDVARHTFREALHKHQNCIDAPGYRMLTTILCEYAKNKRVTVSVHTVGIAETRDETWKKWTTTSNEVPTSRVTAYVYPGQPCFYKEEEVHSIAYKANKIVYVRSLCKSKTEEE